MKRKSAGSKSTAAGAVPPARRLRTGEGDETVEANKNRLTAEHSAELHDFGAWLEIPDATRIRGSQIDTDRHVVKELFSCLATTTALESCGPRLGQKQNIESLRILLDLY